MDLLSEAQLTEQLNQVAHLIEELSAALAAERNALASHSSNGLDEATQSKQRALDALEPLAGALMGDRTSASIEVLAPAAKAKLDAHHKAVMTAARHAKESNAVNGKIVTRSQQSLLELVQLMTGSTAQPTYSESGQFETSNAQGIHRVQV